ncbi:MAG TPA: DUF2520 domain-containing protein [Pyrinomonadaceae bacterium]|nr:DUF2520 domain-containing protein [Pyrinomonadaceae bacterium]
MAKTKNVKRNSARKPSVSLIGPGRLGIALAMALESAGYKIVSLVGLNRQKLRKTAQLLDVSCQLLVAKELEKGRLGDLIIVSVPDDQIVTVAGDLARIKGNGHPTVLHTSGALSSKVFASLAANGWHTGSIHPLASVSDPEGGVEALRRAYWCIEGDAKATRLARRIVRDLGARAFSIDAKDKPVYHAAAVMSSGNVVSVFDVALDMLNSCGLSRREAQKILLPLLESTALNLSRADPKDALTGTFARGDLETVKLHLAALSEKQLNEALNVYRLLGEHSVKLASTNLSSEAAREILRSLDSQKE